MKCKYFSTCKSWRSLPRVTCGRLCPNYRPVIGVLSGLLIFAAKTVEKKSPLWNMIKTKLAKRGLDIDGMFLC